MPALKKRGPMRSSRPMPWATLATSAPTSSQIVAISLMKLILVARKALAAYLIISALARSVVTNGTAAFGLGSSWVGKVCSNDRLVQGAHRIQGVPFLGPEHDPVREEGIVDGASLPQKLGVGDHPVIHGRPPAGGTSTLRRALRGALLNEHRDVVAGADRHGALVDHHQRAFPAPPRSPPALARSPGQQPPRSRGPPPRHPPEAYPRR